MQGLLFFLIRDGGWLWGNYHFNFSVKIIIIIYKLRWVSDKQPPSLIKENNNPCLAVMFFFVSPIIIYYAMNDWDLLQIFLTKKLHGPQFLAIHFAEKCSLYAGVHNVCHHYLCSSMFYQCKQFFRLSFHSLLYSWMVPFFYSANYCSNNSYCHQDYCFDLQFLFCLCCWGKSTTRT